MPIFNDMTNKEAAKVLNDYSTVNRNASLPYINEAIHAAIKALDQIDNIKAQNAESVQRYNGEKQSRDCCQTERHISSVGMKAKSLPYLISFVSQNIF